MNGYQVQDDWIKHARGQRQKLQKAEIDRRARAQSRIAEHLPDLTDGHGTGPCNFAVYALLALWTKHGEGNVTPAMIRSERRRLIDRNGWELA